MIEPERVSEFMQPRPERRRGQRPTRPAKTGVGGEILRYRAGVRERVGDGSSRITVPDGLAAASVSSDDVLAVGGAIRAGSVVDVYVETAKGEISLIGERILVLETSTPENTKKEQITWVTLAVKPSSVNELLAASSKGTIHFVLPGNSAARQEG